MLLARYWLDADGKPHREEVTLAPGPADAPAITIPDGVEADGSPITGPVMVLALKDPAAGIDQLAGQLHQVYAADLPDGVTLVDRATWQTATDDRATARAASLAEFQAQADEAQATRLSALAKLAESAGLTDDERAALLGGA